MRTSFADAARFPDRGATAVGPWSRNFAALRTIRNAGDDLA